MQSESSRILITGGGRGLGRAIAEWLAARGATIGLIARTPNDLHDVVGTIEGAGGSACAQACDVRDRARLDKAVSSLAHTLGGLDALVCAAGQLRGIGPTALLDANLWWEDVETAVRGVHHTIRAALPWLRRSARASINVLVGPGHQGSLPFATGYGCAQAALVRLVESLAHELTAENIVIYGVNPGLAPTGIMRPLIDTHEGRRWLPQFNEAFAEGKEVAPSIAAEMVAWLIEDRPIELNGRVVAAPLTPAILATRLERVRSENLGVLRLR
jgi:3-oxoacyl-[acyl-carrier protein] reductase